MKAVILDQKDFVQVAGPDARKFLQGQVSCNMELLTAQQSLTGVLCNLKGRVIADFRAIQVNDAVWLQTEKGMGQQLIDVLGKYAVFSKVEISLITAVAKSMGLFGKEVSPQVSERLGDLPSSAHGAASSDDVITVRLPVGAASSSTRFELIPLNHSGEATLADLLKHCQPSSQADWDRLDIEAGIVHVRQQDSEQFTPQLLNYDISGVIDFKKGCYTGQEIVARMYYRSTAKKRLCLLSGAVDVNPHCSICYWDSGKEQTAEILRLSPRKNTQESSLILAILGTDAMNSDTPPRLFDTEKSDNQAPANNSESSLQFLTLPYTE